MSIKQAIDALSASFDHPEADEAIAGLALLREQAPQQSCPTCAALARTVMCDQVSFDRKPDCYGIRQLTDDEGVEEWEDIRTSPDVAREEANDMMATGRGEIYEVVPLWTTPQPAPATQQAPQQSGVGNSAFESWYNSYSPAHKSDKQRALDAYAAGMGDPLVTTAPAIEAQGVLDVDSLTDAIAECLRGTYHCTRVWEAWHVGTMDQDDFEPVDESDTPRELAETVIAMLAATQQAPQQSGVGNSGFDHKTAADFLNGKTVSDEAMRKFVNASRWTHDDRAGLRAMLLSARNELAAREAEIALLKTALMDAEVAPQQEAQEPVARLEIGKTKGGVSLTHIPEPAAFQLPEGMHALYTHQAPAQQPLTDEQIQDLLGIGNPTEEECRLIRLGWEAANGIGGEKP